MDGFTETSKQEPSGIVHHAESLTPYANGMVHSFFDEAIGRRVEVLYTWDEWQALLDEVGE